MTINTLLTNIYINPMHNLFVHIFQLQVCKMGTHIKQNRTCHEKLGDADDPSLSSASYGGHLSNLSSTSNSDFVGGVKTGEDIQHTESTCKNNGRNAKSYRDGTRTLTLLVHESQKEVAQKEKEIAELRRKVGILQSRLVNNGLSSVTSSMETDLMIPGVSRRLLDSVIKENCRLKLLLQKKGGMPQKIEELTGVGTVTACSSVCEKHIFL